MTLFEFAEAILDDFQAPRRRVDKCRVQRFGTSLGRLSVSLCEREREREREREILDKENSFFFFFLNSS